MSDESFPLAETRSESSAKSLVVSGVSRMWIATIVCLLIAIGLTWYSLGDSGSAIVLHFKQGHGLKPGDAVRDRGIDIGTVTSVRLNKELNGIEVHAELNPAAEAIAREGSRFWIVRPKLDITGISGLETAVGSKYIAVAPGPIAGPIRKHDFIGLESPPVDELGQGGLELVLRGDERFGVNPGSPVNWRGIEVGQVLSSGLSPDALHVDTRIRIDSIHRRLVARNSMFWVTSGVHLDAGVTGVEFSAESLATIVRGGVAFITPEPVAKRRVEAGDVFTLHEKEDQSWTEHAAAINSLQNPPPMIELNASWQEELLGFTRSKSRHSLAVVVHDRGANKVIVPAEFLAVPEDASENTFKIEADVTTNGQANRPEVIIGEAIASDHSAMAVLPIKELGSVVGAVAMSSLRAPLALEDCFAVRRPKNGGVVTEAIGKHELTVDGNRWRTTKSGLSRDVWYGAPVLSAADEKIIGVLSFTDDHIYVVPASSADFPKGL